MTATSGYWHTAHNVCTQKQLRVLELRELHGFSLSQIAYATNTGIPTVRGHLRAAHHKIDVRLNERVR